MLVTILLGALLATGLFQARRWRSAARRQPPGASGSTPTIVEVLVGAGTNFFDTLGIGSFATTTTVYRLFRLVPDELIPGTMIVGHALPVVTQALFFISVVDVDPWQMTLLIVSCVAGGWLGAGIVAALSRRAIQLGMGCALLVAAVSMLLGLLGLFPAGGSALVFAPRAYAIAVAVNFVLGALVTLGIGNYAPSLVTFSLLGMDPRAAFPIMAGSGAFVATIAGVRFIGAGRFNHRAALGLTVGGIPAVIIAAWLVQSLPLAAVQWLVLMVVMFTSMTLLRAGVRGTETDRRAAPMKSVA